MGVKSCIYPYLYRLWITKLHFMSSYPRYLLTYFANFVIIIPSLKKTIAFFNNILQNTLPLNAQTTFFPQTIAHMTSQRNPLRLNVGFIIHESPGFSREFQFDMPKLAISPETEVENLKGAVRFDRTQRGILVTGNFTAEISAECVRCLDHLIQPITTDFLELYAFDKRTTTEAELIVPEDGFLDLNPVVSEYLLLAFPIKPICKIDCAGLCPVCGINHNHEECDHIVDDIDPRLSQLKDLLDE